MTADEIAECMALFDRVNPEPDISPLKNWKPQYWEEWAYRRRLFKRDVKKTPGIALGAVIDYCLPEGMVYTVSTCEPGPYAWVGRPGDDTVAHMDETPALAMVRAINAAMDAGEPYIWIDPMPLLCGQCGARIPVETFPSNATTEWRCQCGNGGGIFRLTNGHVRNSAVDAG